MNPKKEEREEREELEDWLGQLRQKGLPIIVEGKKDRAALARLGIANTIQLEGALYEVVERIAEKHRRVILLTDLDPEGKKLYSRLKRELGEHGVIVDDKFREFLFKKTKLRQIEGLDSYIEKLEASGK